MENKVNNKIIHYIWFGGNPISELTKKCIQTWKKYLPDFEIKEWNESNFDVNQCPFVKQAYEQKKWAFVADYTRFKVLEEYGGIYLDTDMEITADISKYLELDLFMGQEDSKMINAAVVWAKEPHNPRIKDIVDYYESCEKFNPTGDLYDQSVPRVLTRYFEKLGFDKELDEIQSYDDGKTKIYPMEYFYPKSYDYQNNRFTENSCMIHHFDATWISPMEKFKTNMKRKNMVWVVYVIDFFIAVKNKIKFFLNFKDILTFLTMFLILMFFTLGLKAVDGTDIFSKVFSTSVLNVLGISLMWTYICAKIRNIDFNFYTDKLLNRKQEDIDNGIITNVKMNAEQEIKANKRTNILFAIEYIMTIIVSLFPMFQVAVVFPAIYTKAASLDVNMWFVLLFIINIYMLFVGMNKKFKYRILELIPFGIILGLLAMANLELGLIISILTFIYSVVLINKNNDKKKRVVVFCISFILSLIVSVIINHFIANDTLGVTPNMIDIFSAEESLLPENSAITEFNYIKNYVVGSITNVEKVILFNNSFIYVALLMVASLLLALVNKNKNYLFFALLILVTAIGINYFNVYYSYLFIIVFAIMLLFLLQKSIVKLLDK